MSIRFKFRSSVNFDTVEIGNRDSISLEELRSRILRGKISQQQQGFDLVFSDAVSGLEYKCDSQIPSGSSVIVKRVPGGTQPSHLGPTGAVKHIAVIELHNLTLPKTGANNDNQGAELCPNPVSDLPGFNQEYDQNNFLGNIKDDDAIIPSGLDQHGNDRNILPIVDEQTEANKLHTSNFLTLQSSNLPLELKCPLCNYFFKDAVMIPCCQHSFCEKCIRQVLIAKGMCPKCSSRKCIVGDLLPNLSLRQAIEHLLESQMFDAGYDDVMQKYAPDGESGIQANDVSCALTVAQRELEVPQSSTATGKGSNQVLTGELYEQHQRYMPYHNPDFQGENQPVLPEAKSHGEVDSNNNRKGGLWFDSGVGGRGFPGPGRYRKGMRNCYSCGSPDHFMRDCPLSHPNPMFPPGSGVFHGGMPGYAPPYWNGSAFPPYTPYANMYNNPPMMPFNPSMVPVSPFGVPPPYISSVCGILPRPGGNMRMGNMEPRSLDHFELQHCVNKRKKHSSENLESDQLSENKDDSSACYQHYSPEKTNHHKKRKEKEQCSSHSDDSLARRSRRKNQHEKHMHFDVYPDERREKGHHSISRRENRLSHVVRPNSAKEDKSRSSDRYKRHHKDSKDNEIRRGNSSSESSFGHHSTQRGIRRRVDSDVHDSHRKHHHNRSDTCLEPQTRADRRAGYREREAVHDSSRLHAQERHHGDRLQVVHESKMDRRDEYRHQKRRAY